MVARSNRIGCHTAYQHYEMFHGHKACGCGNSVFNIVTNTGRGCNCSSGGGFWSGIGMGFGMGFANLFSGLLGNIFGGFGFGFPSFGGGWGDFGLGGHQLSSRNTNNTQGAENKDYEKLNKLFERKNKLLGQEKPSVKDLETLLNDIVALEKNLDGNEDKKDKDYIKQLKFGLQDKINELKGTPDNDGKAKVQQPAQTVDNSQPEPKVVPQVVDNTPKEGEVTIGGKNIKIDDIKSLDDIKGLSPDDLKNISADNAKKILENLGIKEGSELSGKVAKSYEALLLLQKAGISVKVAKNIDTKTKTVDDPWIEGPIQDVRKNSQNGNVSYNVNCKNCGCGQQGNIYHLYQESENKFKVGIKEFGKNISYDDPKVSSVEYTITDENKAMVRDGRRFTKDISKKGNK